MIARAISSGVALGILSGGVSGAGDLDFGVGGGFMATSFWSRCNTNWDLRGGLISQSSLIGSPHGDGSRVRPCAGFVAEYNTLILGQG